MAKKKTFTVEDLWRIERLGTPSLAPDGAQAVAALTRFSMDDNKSAVVAVAAVDAGRRAAAAHALRRQGRRAALEPARRSHRLHRQARAAGQEGRRDAALPDRARRRRGAPRRRGGHRRGGLPLVPRRPAAAVRRPGSGPDSKGHAAQAKAHKAFKERKETGYATSEAQYRYWDHNLPMGRVAAPAPAGTARRRPAGQGARPVRGHALRAEPLGPRRQPVRHLARRPPHRLRLRPGSREARRRPLCAGRDGPEERPDRRSSCATPSGTSAARATAPTAERIAFTASHQGRKHTMPAQLAVWDARGRPPPRGQRRVGPRGARPAALGRRRPGAALHRRAEGPHATCGASTCPTTAPRSWWPAAG